MIEKEATVLDEILALIEVKQDQETKDKAVFRELKHDHRELLGRKIFDDLMKRRKDAEFANKTIKCFYLDSENEKVGLMSMLYGLTGILSLINRYKLKVTAKQKEEIKEMASAVLAYTKNNGYDASPYVSNKINEEFFLSEDRVKDRLSYMGARTWAFSLFISLYTNAKELGISDEDKKEVKKRIRECTQFFVKNVIRDENGNPTGWGFADGCEEPSLFFTYSVIEAFSEFDDAFMGGADEEGIDEEMLAFINKNSEVKYDAEFLDIVFKIGDRAWDLFKDKLRDELFSDAFDKESIARITKEQVENSSRSPVLFNTLYVIFILFYSYKNNRQTRGLTHLTEKQKIEKQKIFDADNIQVQNAMSLALQNIQNFYDDMQRKGKEAIVERNALILNQKHERKGLAKELSSASIQAGGFIPMSAKANNLIARYNYKFPQQKMGLLLNDIFMMRRPDEWLWSERIFDLLETERCLESIADFFDYYKEFEQPFVSKSLDDTRRRKEIREDLVKTLGPAAEKRAEEKMKMQLEKELHEKLEEERQKYTIEIAINQRIESKINEGIVSFIEEFVKNPSEKAAASTVDNESDKNAIEEKRQQMLSSSKEDVKKALQEFFKYIDVEGKSLKDIFTLLGGKK
ncbi:MAG: hypothetical protein FWE22_04185 [Firmicutes bacterium]|nr:hypothetical protein [Bacillota bacterium]